MLVIVALAAQTQAADDPDQLSLARAISIALERHPELEALRLETLSAKQMVRQRRLWPNPSFEYERENFGGTGVFEGDENAESTLSVSQALPLNGERRVDESIALLESDIVLAEYSIAQLDVIRDVQRTFVASLMAEQTVELATRNLILAEQVKEIAKQRVLAGDTSPLEETRALLPVVSAEILLERAEQQRETARRTLALQVFGTAETDSVIAGNIHEIEAPPALSALVSKVSDSPSISRWATEVSRAETVLRHEKSQRLPNPSLRLGMKESEASGDRGYIVGISLPVPLFDRNQGRIAAARSEIDAIAARKRSVERALEIHVTELHARVSLAYSESLALRDRAIPAAQRSFEATQHGYEAGEYSLIEVLDSQQALLETESRYLASLESYHLAQADLEATLGGSSTNP